MTDSRQSRGSSITRDNSIAVPLKADRADAATGVQCGVVGSESSREESSSRDESSRDESTGCKKKVVTPELLASILEQVETLRGEQFLERITPLLATAIQADYTFIGRVDDGLTTATTLCLCEGDKVIDNFTYDLANTPCRNVTQEGVCAYPSDICSLFPEDQLLIDMGIEAYLGAPLYAPDGRVLGLMVALYHQKIDDFADSTTLFKIFTGRISAEISAYETQQALEAELQKSRALQEQYQLLARQERDARHRAQKANRVKSAFVANMSHEVKTPMNAMLAFCQMLLKSELNQSQRLQVQSMLDAGQQLMTMLNDVLELSRLEDGITELPENAVQSYQLLDGVVEQAASQLLQKPISLTYTLLPEVPAELVLAEYHVQKVVINLLSNAIKFTQSGQIHIELSFVAESDEVGSLVIAIADTGVGIAEQFLPELFEPFTQQNTSNSRVHGGAGLGLHLAHRLAATMDGTIDVTSVVGQGSVFTLRLPVGLMPSAYKRPVPATTSVAVMRFHDEHHCVQSCLESLGATVVNYDAMMPLALQAVQFPGIGIVLDMSEGLADAVSIEEVVTQARPLNIPIVALVSQEALRSSAVAKILSEMPHVRAPVLMHEWLEIMETMIPPEAAGRESQVGSPQAEDRILLVEDNRLNQEIALCILEDAGYKVDVACNGQEAVDNLTASPAAYQLVLMDIQMPIMDGLEATRIIRKDLDIPVPIVAVTAGIAVQDRQQCDEAGMDDFIPKPIDEDFVLQKVRYYMSGSHHAAAQ